MTTRSSEQAALNTAEWHDPSNWGGPRWIEIYFSKRDTRIWVRKRIRWMGWTVNLAHTGGVLWFFGIILSSFALVIGTSVWTIGFR